MFKSMPGFTAVVFLKKTLFSDLSASINQKSEDRGQKITTGDSVKPEDRSTDGQKKTKTRC